MHPINHNSSYIDALRISAAEQDEILQELEGHTDHAAALERRRQRRQQFKNSNGLIIQLRHPGGSTANFLVCTRDISATGIGFLHGAFVYPKTTCSVALKDRSGKIITIEGKIARCRHLRKHIHDVGLQFNNPIDLVNFISGSAPVTGNIPVSHEIPKLKGNVLVVSDSPNDQELLKFHLESLGITAITVPSGLDALGLIDGMKFDAIITELFAAGMSGIEFVQTLRQGGYEGELIAITADDRPETSRDAITNGCDNVLIKPYAFPDLVALMSQCLASTTAANDDADNAPLHSDHWSDLRMRPLIERFLGRLTFQVTEIEKLSENPAALPLLQRFCLDLKGAAGGYGYPQISTTAAKLLELLLNGNADQQYLREVLDSLKDLAHRAALVLGESKDEVQTQKGEAA